MLLRDGVRFILEVTRFVSLIPESCVLPFLILKIEIKYIFGMTDSTVMFVLFRKTINSLSFT